MPELKTKVSHREEPQYAVRSPIIEDLISDFRIEDFIIQQNGMESHLDLIK